MIKYIKNNFIYLILNEHEKRYFFVLIFFVFIQVFGQNQKIKVFLNCRCDDDFLKQNTLFFDYVRDMSLT